ncbi:MAG TPA: NAD(P)/FAD-dependent oxidoreductase [Candidatus Wunengus sp. YC60]|uniref:NAD(P)/FAD-dependent oxidoreductase n=1 Tax=Candidatus Wunengus sp. YC60 TaxID=3367697 RepID=UPI0040295314
MAGNYLIIGSGPAGITAAENIRNLDNKGKITVVSEERVPMFFRPRIPEYAVGKLEIEEIMVKKMDFYDQNRIRLRLGIRAVKLDNERKIVETSDGQCYGYDKLLIATGIVPLKPSVPGQELKGIFTMHDLIQADRVRAFAREAKQVVVVGGGLLGMDMAEELKRIGLGVKFLVRRPVLGDPFFDEYGCKLIHEEFTLLGVDVLADTEIQAFEGMDSKLAKIVTTDRKQIESSFCFLSIGAVPAVNWLEESGLKIDKGVLVDGRLQSSEESIFSAGNSAQITDTVSKKQIVQTNWYNASTQGRIAGSNMTGGEPIEYKATTNYLKKVGNLSFNLIGCGNAIVEMGRRTYFKGDNPREYAMITTKEGVIAGAVVCGLPKISMKLKEVIERQKVIPNLEKFVSQKEGQLDMLLKILA